MPRCIVCKFGLHACPPRSAAFVVTFGTQAPNDAWRSMIKRAEKTSIPCVSAYCEQCSCIRAITNETNATDALVQHEVQWREWNFKP